MRRNIKNPLARKAFFILAGALALFHILIVTVWLLDTIYIVAVDLMVGMVLIFCMYPATQWSPKDRMTILDAALALAAIAIGIHTITQCELYLFRLGEPTIYDLIMGCLAIVLTLEAVRRTTGFVLPTITTLFLLYCFLGKYAPSIFRIMPVPFEQVIFMLFCGLHGIYGTILIVMGTIIFLFIIFAGFIKQSAVGNFFMDLSFALVGRTVGGPAKLAVTASGLMGMLTGAGTANVVATGNITIPLMKKYGYKPQIAGAIEAAASVGGQLLPPIMGAAAFIIAQVTGESYATICVVSFLPALLYMGSVMFYVHLEAKKTNIKLIDQKNIPDLKEVLKRGVHLIVPVIILFILIIMEYSLARAALLGTASVVVVSCLRRHTRMNFMSVLQAFKVSGLDMLMLLSAGAAAGIILGVVSLTGLGIKISSIFLSVSGGNLFLMVCLVGLASLIFGMGLPIVASYIVLATLAGPALESLGVPVLIAHLVILWFSIDAAVTPPVAITSYVAAGIAEAPIMPTVWEAWKAAKGLYVIPFLMVYSPLISGNLFQKLEVTLMAFFGLYALTASWKGYLFRRTLLPERFLLIPVALLLFLPSSKGYLPLTHVAGLLFFLCLGFINKKMFINSR